MKAMFKYYKGIVDEDELKEKMQDLHSVGIDLILHDESGVPIAFLDQFTNQVYIALSDAAVQGFILGIANAASYDILKSTIIWMWNSVAGKKLTKLSGGGKIEENEATFGLHLSVDTYTKIEFRLSGDVPDSLKSKCIEEAFKFANEIPRKHKRAIAEFAKYDWSKNEWELIDVNKEMNRLIREQKMKE